MGKNMQHEMETAIIEPWGLTCIVVPWCKSLNSNKDALLLEQAMKESKRQ